MIYLNGSFLKSDEALLPVSDRGLLLGDGIFETMLADQGKIQSLESHWQRLTSSLEFLNIPIPIDYEKLQTTIQELLAKNNLLTTEAAIRLTVTRGSGKRGIMPSEPSVPHFFITASPYLRQQTQSLKMIIATLRRNESSPLTKIKSLNYLENILGRLEASNLQADDALFLNTRGFVTESTVANIFMVVNGVVLTPAIEQGLIPGITRAKVLTLCSRLNIPIREGSILPESLFAASELFLTNSLIGIQPVFSLNNYEYPRTNPLTQHISDFYAKWEE